MPYSALPDRRMPYDIDGSVMAVGNVLTNGVLDYATGSDLIELNDSDYAQPANSYFAPGTDAYSSFWLFFPESREVTAGVTLERHTHQVASVVLQGSNDSTNGLDGTWETPTLAAGAVLQTIGQIDNWRTKIRPISFTGSKRVIRHQFLTNGGFGNSAKLYTVHFYGKKAAGQTPHDLIFINHQDAPGAEYQAPQDFGDRPLGTTVTHEFRVKNASATLTANSINLQCNDSDFAISTDGSTWVTTINIPSLAAGAESATMYVRCTTPNPGAVLGPRFARIVALVGSWA